MPSARASDRTARTIAVESPSSSIPLTKLWSIFRRSIGSFCSDESEVKPVPKSSIAMRDVDTP